MAEPELFVICPNCGSEVSPYVTECPYCGNRVRKRAPDLKKDRKQREKAEKKAERDAEKRRKRTKELLTGRAGGGVETPEYLRSGRPPLATTTLISAAVVLSVAMRARGFPPVDWVFSSSLTSRPWLLFTSPFFNEGYGYAFVCLLAVAMFGSGIERRFGAAAVVAVWLVCGAAGVAAEYALAPDTLVANGALAVAVGMMTAWLIHVLQREDLRDYDPFGLVAVSAVLFAMPLVSDEASVWMILGGLAGGALCGALLLLRTARV